MCAGGGEGLKQEAKSNMKKNKLLYGVTNNFLLAYSMENPTIVFFSMSEIILLFYKVYFWKILDLLNIQIYSQTLLIQGKKKGKSSYLPLL